MDIVTHAMAGTILASPLLPIAPLSASFFVLGSVLPDADALSRLFGKVAFLRWHQTFTHSLPVICAVTVLFWPSPGWLGVQEAWAPAALGAGMLLHALMDATNTYGVALLAPVGRKRYCTEWVFFIDGIVIAFSILCLVLALILVGCDQSSSLVTASYGCFLLGYWLLHRRAVRMAPDSTRSLIPSAVIPWRFFGFAAQGDGVCLFELNAIHGAITKRATRKTFDSKYELRLNRVVEYRMMRELSSGYCTVEASEQNRTTKLVCRDLRTRNFGGQFGQLELSLDADGKVERKVLHV